MNKTPKFTVVTGDVPHKFDPNFHFNKSDGIDFFSEFKNGLIKFRPDKTTHKVKPNDYLVFFINSNDRGNPYPIYFTDGEKLTAKLSSAISGAFSFVNMEFPTAKDESVLNESFQEIGESTMTYVKSTDQNYTQENFLEDLAEATLDQVHIKSSNRDLLNEKEEIRKKILGITTPFFLFFKFDSTGEKLEDVYIQPFIDTLENGLEDWDLITKNTKIAAKSLIASLKEISVSIQGMNAPEITLKDTLKGGFTLIIRSLQAKALISFFSE